MKIFDSNNIFGPIKFILRLLFGIKFNSATTSSNRVVNQTLEQMWSSQNQSKPSSLLPRKILGMSGALLKSVVLVFIGAILQFTLFLIKRSKARKLDQIKLQEEQEAEERKRVMEEEWRK